MRKITYHELGTEEYPIPVMDRTGTGIVWLASEEDSIVIPTMRDDSPDEFYGRFMRQVVTDPTMMPDMTEILLRLDKSRTPKEAKSYGYTAMGAPGNGKTYLAKQLGALVHPSGALVVDCNNIDNADELFKVTTFNVSASAKQDKIQAKIELGNRDAEEALKPQTILYMKKMLGNDIVSQEMHGENKITAVDWRGINQEPAYVEAVLDKVLEMENIKYEKEGSSLGFVVSNGPLLRALIDPESPDYGRMVVRDESNRGPVVDAWLQISAFFSEPSVEKLVLKGADDKEFTIYRNQIPETFMFLGTANNATEEMGLSAKEMTRPMISREGMGVDIRQISEPTKKDYISRALKHMTGVPAYYVYMTDVEGYNQNPRELAAQLMYLRKVGLSDEEIKMIPEEELFNIKHIDRTIDVAKSYGSLLFETQKLIENACADEGLPNEYREYLKANAVVDLRYVYKLYQHAKTERPKGKVGSKVFAKLGQKKAEKSQEEVQYELSQRIVRREKNKLLVRGTMFENEIAIALHKMLVPEHVETLLGDYDRKESMQRIEALWKSLEKVAKNQSFKFAGYIGADAVEERFNAKPEDFPKVAENKLAEVLVSSMRETYQTEDLKVEDVFDPHKLEEALALLGQDGEGAGKVFMPNPDLEGAIEAPLISTDVELSALSETTPDKLITTAQLADSFIIPQLRKHNIEEYRKKAEGLSLPEYTSIDDDTARQNVFELYQGKHKDVVVAPLFVQDIEAGRTGNANVIFNKATDAGIIFADFDVSQDDVTRLADANISFVNVYKADAEADVFVQDKDGRVNLNRRVDDILKGSDVKQSVAISALLINDCPELATATMESATDYCTLIVNRDTLDGNDVKAVAIVNPIVQAAMRAKGR